MLVRVGHGALGMGKVGGHGTGWRTWSRHKEQKKARKRGCYLRGNGECKGRAVYSSGVLPYEASELRTHTFLRSVQVLCGADYLGLGIGG